jgi:putative transposase
MIVAEFIASCRTRFGIPHAIACRALEVSQSWFYKWINRAPTARQQRRAALDEEIKRLFTASGGTYGSPRITDDLRDAGWKVSVNTVAARMAELGLAGRVSKKRRGLTRPGRRPAAPDLVRRNFTAVAADVLWCGDVTQIDTEEGPLYLATTEDLFSRRMLGHAMSAHHNAALVVASLQMAATVRGGDVER